MSGQHEAHAQRALVSEHIVIADGTWLAWAIAPDGSAWPWVLDLTAKPSEQERCWQERAPHEATGPLPETYTAALTAPRDLRCGARRRDGGTCRARVATAGTHCHHHLHAPTASGRENTNPTTDTPWSTR
ncbi:hypothetical protein [Kineococcus terrestris]|uniref:hypothetical protein n=1 Tax=Kineococcus terrestris TaxID=2044856 RepID=UPI0034DB7690